MRNNAHFGETKEQRLRRFNEGHPYEVVATIINSIGNNFVNELRTVFDNDSNPQTSLMFLGTHSIALTIAFGLWGKDRKDGYDIFLRHFIDGDTDDAKFSQISDRIHEWRNVIAHRWINAAGHNFGYDFGMREGWKGEGEFLMINPRIYLQQFLNAFGQGGKVYRYGEVLNTEQMWRDAKARFISKYTGDT